MTGAITQKTVNSKNVQACPKFYWIDYQYQLLLLSKSNAILFE